MRLYALYVQPDLLQIYPIVTGVTIDKHFVHSVEELKSNHEMKSIVFNNTLNVDEICGIMF